jgi:hypothetical protein
MKVHTGAPLQQEMWWMEQLHHIKRFLAVGLGGEAVCVADNSM